jgi:amino acid permease
MILLSGAASIYGLTLLTICASRVGRHSSFFAVSNITYPQAAIWFDLAIAIKCFGVSISYLVIIGDLVSMMAHPIFDIFFLHHACSHQPPPRDSDDANPTHSTNINCFKLFIFGF